MPEDPKSQGSAPEAPGRAKGSADRPGGPEKGRRRGLPLRGALARKDTWLGQNWKTVLAIVLVFALALFIRAYFGWEMATNGGDDFLLSGGSDSYYHKRVIDYGHETGEHLTRDEMLNYPIGTRNPRPPLYDWSNVYAGKLLAPVLGMEDETAIWYSFELSTAVWGALTILPLYFIGREIFDKRTALVAALFLAIMAAHVERSTLSNADHDAFALFFIVTGFFFFLKSLRTIRGDRWVEKWSSWKAATSGLKGYVSANKRSLLYSVMAGFMLSVVALSWQGYAYSLVIILIFLTLQVALNVFRKKDSLAVTAIFITSWSVLLITIFPYYYLNLLFHQWYSVPLILFAIATIASVYFTVTRDVPWILTIPIALAVGGIAYGLAYWYDPAITNQIVSGAGYFVQTKAYETIAEAQAPDFSRLAMAFGVLTFFASIAGVGFMAYRIRHEASTAYMFLVVWTATGIFMALAAARFLFNASPAFALASAWIVVMIYDKMEFAKIVPTFKKFRESPFKALKKSIKVTQALVLLVFVALVLAPNVWFAADAGIPYEKKSDYDEEINDVVPAWAQPDTFSEDGYWYLGAFGYSLPLRTNYYPAAYQWLSEQDTDIPNEEDRPAYISWWDYGFEAVQEGDHPTVADNFLGGHRLAGNFLMSQNESEAIALLSVRIIEGDWVGNDLRLSSGVSDALSENGLSPDFIDGTLGAGDKYLNEVASHPEKYGPMDRDRLNSQNANYAVLRYYMTSRLNADQLADLYCDLQGATGDIIRYAAVDSRLFPFSASNTGIFYAPAKLSDRRIDEDTNSPYDFYEVKAVGIYGEEYPVDDLPDDFELSHYKLEYKEMFLNSMLYRIYVGYSGLDTGEGTEAGVPGLSGDLETSYAQQGWMLSHFKLAYKTAYWNPYKDYENHTEDWVAMGYDEVYAKALAGEGTPNLYDKSGLQNGVVILKYYHGAMLSGQVTLADGTPYEGLYVTVRDKSLGSPLPATPHQRVETDAEGRYSVLLPFGDVEVVVSRGTIDAKTQVGSEIIETASYAISDEAAMREKVDKDRDGVYDYLLHRDFVVKGGTLDGTLYWDVDGDGSYNENNDAPMVNGSVQLILDNAPTTLVAAGSDGKFVATEILPGSYRLGAYYRGYGFETAKRVEVTPGKSNTESVGVKPASLRVNATAGSDIELTVRANGETLKGTADAEGVCRFEFLMPGNYTVQASAPGLLSHLVAAVLDEGTEESVDLELEEVVEFKGATYIDGIAKSGVSMLIWHSSEPTTYYSVFSGVHGKFSARVPPGKYVINAEMLTNGVVYVYVGSVDVRGQEVVVALTRGYAVRGQPHTSSVNEHISLPVEFHKGGGYKRVFTDAFGKFETYLPMGTYQAVVSYDGLFASEKFHVKGETALDVALGTAANVQGYAYCDENGNGVRDDGEGVGSVRVVFAPSDGGAVSLSGDRLEPLTVSGQYTLQAVSEEGTGLFGLYLGQGRSYDIYTSIYGYDPVGPIRIVAPKPSLELAMPKSTAEVSVSVVDSDGAPIQNVDGTMSAAGRQYAFQTDERGMAVIDAVPGNYSFQVWDEVYEGDDAVYYGLSDENAGVEILLGQESASADVSVLETVRLKFDIAQNDTFNVALDGGKDYSFSVDSREPLNESAHFVAIGEYTMVVSGGSDGKGIFHITVDSPDTMDIDVPVAYRTEGYLRTGDETIWGSVNITVSDDAGYSETIRTNVNGRYQTDLPPGEYMLLVDEVHHTEAAPIRYHRLTGSRNLTVVGALTGWDIQVEPDLANTTYSGRVVSPEGNPVAGKALQFKPKDGQGIFAQTVTKQDGIYSIGLAPADYTLFSPNDADRMTYLNEITVAYSAETVAMNLTLEHAYKLRGIVSLDANKVSATVKVQEAGSTDSLSAVSSSTGYYTLYLPEGDYRLTCSKLVGGLNYTYGTDVTVSGDTMVNPSLSREPARDPCLMFKLSDAKTVHQGMTLDYAVSVRNDGDAWDIYDFTATPTAFAASFSPSDLTLDPDETGTVTVSVPITASIGPVHEPMKVTATSRFDSSVTETIELPFTVVENAKFLANVSALPNPTVKEGKYSQTVVIKNMGNMDDTYDLSVLNLDELASKGWNVTMVGGGGAQGDGTLENVTGTLSQPEVTVTVTLTPTREHPSRDAVATVVAKSDSNPGEIAVMQLTYKVPVLEFEKGGITVGGEGVSYESDESFPYWTIPIIVAVVVLAVSGYLYWRGRKW